MNMLDLVRRIVPSECLTDCCVVGNCHATASERIRVCLWLDLECVRKSDGVKRCDYLFFGLEAEGGRRWIVAIEFKSSKPVAGDVTRQLQASADYAARFVEGGKGVGFQAIVIHGGSVRTREYRKFKNEAKRVSFRGMKIPVRAVTRHAKLPLPQKAK